MAASSVAVGAVLSFLLADLVLGSAFMAPSLVDALYCWELPMANLYGMQEM